MAIDIPILKLGGASAFLSLSDTPNTYAGQGGKFPKVKAGENGLEFVALEGGGDMLAANYDPTNVIGDAFSMGNMVETATKKIMTNTERTNLGKAVLDDNTDASGYGFVVDEDDMSSNLATKIPTQQSVKEYADTKLAKSGGQLLGTIDANNNHIDNVKTLQYNSEVDNGTKTTDATITFSNGQNQKVTLTSNIISLTLDNPTSVGHFQLKIVNGGLATLTWAATSGSVIWLSLSQPSLKQSGTDIIRFYYDGVNFYGIMDNGISIEPVSRTINIDNSMTAAQIQAKIDLIGKYIPDGVTITLQFADGTYTLNQTLLFSGFIGGGSINVYGNSTNNSLNTTKNVILNSSGNPCMHFLGNNIGTIQLWYLKVIQTGGAGNDVVKFTACNAAIDTRYCFMVAYTGSTRYCLYVAFSFTLTAYANYFTEGLVGVYSSGSMVVSNNNDDTGVVPDYGIQASNGGIIGKVSTQPSGSIANESSTNGGVIR